jgi:hypothetical protein
VKDQIKTILRVNEQYCTFGRMQSTKKDQHFRNFQRFGQLKFNGITCCSVSS